MLKTFMIFHGDDQERVGRRVLPNANVTEVFYISLCLQKIFMLQICGSSVVNGTRCCVLHVLATVLSKNPRSRYRGRMIGHHIGNKWNIRGNIDERLLFGVRLLKPFQCRSSRYRLVGIINAMPISRLITCATTDLC